MAATKLLPNPVSFAKMSGEDLKQFDPSVYSISCSEQSLRLKVRYEEDVQESECRNITNDPKPWPFQGK